MEDIRKGVCPLCKHNEIVRSLLFAVGANDPAPVVVATEKTMNGDSVEIYPRGRLASYMCRRCGFTQLFSAVPDNVPVGLQFGTTLITGPSPEGPYR
jgi:hypothetical protein